MGLSIEVIVANKSGYYSESGLQQSFCPPLPRSLDISIDNNTLDFKIKSKFDQRCCTCIIIRQILSEEITMSVDKSKWLVFLLILVCKQMCVQALIYYIPGDIQPSINLITCIRLPIIGRTSDLLIESGVRRSANRIDSSSPEQ